jgi:tRNA threonylcarbamoyladenosine biosynthesis protein TsaB
MGTVRTVRTVRTLRTVIILALDTTTKSGSIAVLNDSAVIALVPGDEARTHGERLPGEIARALDEAGITRATLDLLAVATGPGAFTGLRIGLAAIQGLAMALDRPVVGVSALDALVRQAADAPADLIAPWMDAQRGDVFASLVARATGEMLEPPTAASPSQLVTDWRARINGRSTLFIGDAAIRDSELIARAGNGSWTTRAPDPLAPQIGAIARERALAGRAGPPHALEPIYVRRPDAEIERDRRSRS